MSMRVNDMIGDGRKRVTTFDRLDDTFKSQAQIDLLRCMRCGKCEVACRDGGYQAISNVTKEAIRRLMLKNVSGAHCAHMCVRLMRFIWLR